MSLGATESFASNGSLSTRPMLAAAREGVPNPQVPNRNISQKLKQLRLQKISQYRRQPLTISTGTYLAPTLSPGALPTTCSGANKGRSGQKVYPEVRVKMIDSARMKAEGIENEPTSTSTLNIEDKAKPLNKGFHILQSTGKVDAQHTDRKDQVPHSQTNCVTNVRPAENVVLSKCTRVDSAKLVGKSKSLIHVTCGVTEGEPAVQGCEEVG